MTDPDLAKRRKAFQENVRSEWENPNQRMKHIDQYQKIHDPDLEPRVTSNLNERNRLMEKRKRRFNEAVDEMRAGNDYPNGHWETLTAMTLENWTQGLSPKMRIEWLLEFKEWGNRYFMKNMLKVDRNNQPRKVPSLPWVEDFLISPSFKRNLLGRLPFSSQQQPVKQTTVKSLLSPKKSQK